MSFCHARPTQGVYNIGSGEVFPILLPSYVSLIGVGIDQTFIDAGLLNNVFYFDKLEEEWLPGFFSEVYYNESSGLFEVVEILLR